MSTHSKPAEEASREIARSPGARIGPNSITRMAEALRAIESEETCAEVFAAAGLAHHLARPPSAMVDEHDVTALQRAAFLHLGPERAARISTDAGRRTGDYLLANRIPRPAQAVLRKLPRRIAARLLLAAMARHAWTFAGSGRFSYETSPRLLLRVDDSPLCRSLRTDAPACHYFAATFERLFVAIISPSTRVVEIECRAAGGALCVFDVSWSTQ